MPNDSVGWQGSWEVGHTIFSSASALKSLIAAAGSDDVQAQAVLAAEALGAGLLVSKKLIPEAIDALNGNESVRIDVAKAFVGLSSGGVRREVRRSTPLIQFFVLITACKPCFLDDEIGSIVFEMMKQSGTLQKIPASPAQLTSLVQQLSGHAESMAPVALMHNLAATMTARNITHAEYFMRLDTTTIADLLVKIFEAMTDQSIVEITLTGDFQAMWLSTVLFWFFEGQVRHSPPQCRGAFVTASIAHERQIERQIERECRNTFAPVQNDHSIVRVCTSC